MHTNPRSAPADASRAYARQAALAEVPSGPILADARAWPCRVLCVTSRRSLPKAARLMRTVRMRLGRPGLDTLAAVAGDAGGVQDQVAGGLVVPGDHVALLLQP